MNKLVVNFSKRSFIDLLIANEIEENPVKDDINLVFLEGYFLDDSFVLEVFLYLQVSLEISPHFLRLFILQAMS